jgi:hypothetical protein
MVRGRSGRVWKISPPLRFEPRTVQAVGSRYTDYAIPACVDSITQNQDADVLQVKRASFVTNSVT